jgi:hypothetical protein
MLRGDLTLSDLSASPAEEAFSYEESDEAGPPPIFVEQDGVTVLLPSPRPQYDQEEEQKSTWFGLDGSQMETSLDESYIRSTSPENQTSRTTSPIRRASLSDSFLGMTEAEKTCMLDNLSLSLSQSLSSLKSLSHSIETLISPPDKEAVPIDSQEGILELKKSLTSREALDKIQACVSQQLKDKENESNISYERIEKNYKSPSHLHARLLLERNNKNLHAAPTTYALKELNNKLSNVKQIKHVQGFLFFAKKFVDYISTDSSHKNTVDAISPKNQL